MAWRVEHKNNVIATSQDYSDQILCVASCFVCCSTMAPKMKKNQVVYADEGPIKWNVELLGSDDLFRRLGLQCNATKAEVQAAFFHIIDAHAEDLSGCQVKALNIARDTLADKAKRSKWLVFYQGSRDGEKPQGAKCWAFEGGKVLGLVQEVACPIDAVSIQESFGSPAAPSVLVANPHVEQAPATPERSEYASDRKRNQLRTVVSAAKQARVASSEKKRKWLSIGRKFELLSLWETFACQLPCGKVIQGICTEDTLLQAFPDELTEGQLAKWKARSEIEFWHLWADKDRTKMRPSKAIAEKHGFAFCNLGPATADTMHPKRLADDLAETLEKHRVGPKPPRQSIIKKTWAGIRDKENEQIREQRRESHAHNAELLQQFSAGTTSLDDIEGDFRKPPEEIEGKAGSAWCHKFRKDYGFTKNASSRVNRNELARDEPRLVNRIKEINRIREEEHIPDELVANADEVWRTRHKLIHKYKLLISDDLFC